MLLTKDTAVAQPFHPGLSGRRHPLDNSLIRLADALSEGAAWNDISVMAPVSGARKAVLSISWWTGGETRPASLETRLLIADVDWETIQTVALDAAWLMGAWNVVRYDHPPRRVGGASSRVAPTFEEATHRVAGLTGAPGPLETNDNAVDLAEAAGRTGWSEWAWLPQWRGPALRGLGQAPDLTVAPDRRRSTPLPAFTWPPRLVHTLHRADITLGTSRLGPNAVVRIGKALYGDHANWRTGLAAGLGVPLHTLEHWLTEGEHLMPAPVASLLLAAEPLSARLAMAEQPRGALIAQRMAALASGTEQ
jgi:hypothetical protein